MRRLSEVSYSLAQHSLDITHVHRKAARATFLLAWPPWSIFVKSDGCFLEFSRNLLQLVPILKKYHISMLFLDNAHSSERAIIDLPLNPYLIVGQIFHILF